MVGAGLLTVADHILTRNNPSEARELLRELLPAGMSSIRASIFGQQFLAAESTHSIGLRGTIEPLVRKHARPAGGLTRPAERRTRLGPNTFPNGSPTISSTGTWVISTVSHRSVASTLRANPAVSDRFRWITWQGGPLPRHSGSDPAERLPLPQPVQPSQQVGAQRADPFEFDAAITAIADELGRSTRPIDYRRRRLALKNWSIDTTLWQEIVELAATKACQPIDYHRHLVSVLIWAQITCGEPAYAPSPIKNQHPAETLRRQRKAPRWALPHNQRPSHRQLICLLDSLADRMASRIDNGHAVSTGPPSKISANGPNSTTSPRPPSRPERKPPRNDSTSYQH
jgi:hypothetical protein